MATKKKNNGHETLPKAEPQIKKTTVNTPCDCDELMAKNVELTGAIKEAKEDFQRIKDENKKLQELLNLANENLETTQKWYKQYKDRSIWSYICERWFGIAPKNK